MKNEANKEINKENNKEVKKERFIQNNKKGMEMVQVAILVAIAIGLGLLFKTHITAFIEDTFLNLTQSKF